MDMLTDMRGKGSPGEHGLQGQQRVSCSSSSPSEISSHQSRLLQQLDQQRRQGLFCDCSVLVEGRLFQAHRNVLFASSGYFRMLLSSGAQGGGAQPVGASFEVFSPEIFSVILDFVYSGRLELRSDNVIEVMSAASYLQMTDVIGYCKGFIRSSLDISAKDEKEDEEQQQQRYPALSSDHTGAPHASFSCATSWRVQNGSGAQPDYRHQQQQQPKDQPPPPSKHPLPQEGLEFRPGKPRSSRQPLHTSLGGVEGDAAVLRFSPGSEGGGGGTAAATGRKKKGWTPAPPLAALSPPDHKGPPPSSSSPSPSAASSSSSSSSKPKADKADELYATLPTIVGVVGLFNQDECPSMRFKCPFCTHTVKRKADLKRHLRCHTGERPYPCEACGKRFTRLEHLRSHFQTIHQAQKLICRKCKRHVTELSGRVVCEGTRRYRLCNDCLLETGCDTPGSANHSAAEPCFEDDEGLSWPMTDEDELAEDSGADLIIQEVEDSDEEMDRKEVKPVIG